ncbi:MAG: mechanosensitive ion channel [Thaumarchaeota archaeon]|jgi:miniconductance mechanosensitive channel|nr:mechanosensitive ion channel family protein [Nitrososphaerales archaeon]NSL73857.1 mechanosensitive ion channel [Nitrososphaerota archaeon]
MIALINSMMLDYPILSNILPLFLLAITSYLSFKITRKFLIHFIIPQINKSKTKLDDILVKNHLFLRISYLIPILIVNNFAYIIVNNTPIGIFTVELVINILIVLVFSRIIDSVLSSITDAYSKRYEQIPLKSYIQIVKIFILILSGLLIISILSGVPPWALLGSIGAISAVLLLIFRDTILSLLANLQITSNKLLQLHDWVEAPAFGADGNVIEIALHTIKVQNWDKTITVIPTHKLIDSSFKNWKGMQRSGGRRIKRAINIDITSIKFCDESMLSQYEKIDLLSSYLKEKKKSLIQSNKNKTYSRDSSSILNSRQLTNIGTFRAYIVSYLKNHEKIRQDMTFLIRQLNPSESGLPIEIYVFANDNNWANYENIQSDILDHLVAATSYFDLRIFQNPSGHDLNKLVKN